MTITGAGGTFSTTSVDIPSGGYTIRAEASGYAPNSVTRTVAPNSLTWGSVPL